ncbi:hypothetical protein LCGC14_0671800, partial [marine sediment metagenome]
MSEETPFNEGVKSNTGTPPVEPGVIDTGTPPQDGQVLADGQIRGEDGKIYVSLDAVQTERTDRQTKQKALEEELEGYKNPSAPDPEPEPDFNWEGLGQPGDPPNQPIQPPPPQVPPVQQPPYTGGIDPMQQANEQFQQYLDVRP